MHLAFFLSLDALPSSRYARAAPRLLPRTSSTTRAHVRASRYGGQVGVAGRNVDRANCWIINGAQKNPPGLDAPGGFFSIMSWSW
jgi:hypothetical protein